MNSAIEFVSQVHHVYILHPPNPPLIFTFKFYLEIYYYITYSKYRNISTIMLVTVCFSIILRRDVEIATNTAQGGQMN